MQSLRRAKEKETEELTFCKEMLCCCAAIRGTFWSSLKYKKTNQRSYLKGTCYFCDYYTMLIICIMPTYWLLWSACKERLVK